MLLSEKQLPNGVTVRVHDDAYRDLPPEEKQRRRAWIGEVGRRIMLNAQFTDHEEPAEAQAAHR